MTRVLRRARRGRRLDISLPPRHEQLLQPIFQFIADHASRNVAYKHGECGLKRFLIELGAGQRARKRHANGAVMAAATAASEGWRVIYLGADLPTAEIVETARRTRARAVGISVVVPDKRNRIEAEIQALETDLDPASRIVIGGSGARGLGGPARSERTLFVETMAEMHSVLGEIART